VGASVGGLIALVVVVVASYAYAKKLRVAAAQALDLKQARYRASRKPDDSMTVNPLAELVSRCQLWMSFTSVSTHLFMFFYYSLAFLFQ
jgi:hypothetical protein